MGGAVGLRILFVKASHSKRVILRNNGSLLEFAMGLAPLASQAFPKKLNLFHIVNKSGADQ